MSIQAFLSAYAEYRHGKDRWHLAKIASNIPDTELTQYAKAKANPVPPRVIRSYSAVWNAWQEVTGRDIVPYPIASRYRGYGDKQSVVAAIESGAALPVLPPRARKEKPVSPLETALRAAVALLGEQKVMSTLTRLVKTAEKAAEKAAA